MGASGGGRSARHKGKGKARDVESRGGETRIEMSGLPPIWCVRPELLARAELRKPA